ncbi:MAG: hypothetical protein HYX68_20710 [Planctomycetes bacterium]|nr:hypothetical protein [Planctomycetota bacterium]
MKNLQPWEGIQGRLVANPGTEAFSVERSSEMPELPNDHRGNLIGAAGFALGLTTLIFLFSAAAAHRELPIYLGCASCVGVPTALAGLVCSIMGCLRRGSPKLFSFFGLAIGVFLILAALPAAFLILKQGR